MAPVEPWNGVAEGEDAAVGRDEPVAVAGRGRCHADDGLVEGDGAGGAVEDGVAEGEDAAVGRDQPVAVAGRGRRHADDGLVEGDGAGGAVEDGVAEGEDAAVGRDEPVAVAGRGRCHADDRLVEVDGAGGAVEGGVAEGEDAAVGRDEPVAVAGRIAAMPTMGWLRAMAPVEPWNPASPKEKMPPSDATNWYPLPDGAQGLVKVSLSKVTHQCGREPARGRSRCRPR